MANSRFTYVRDFELADKVLPNTWMLVRIDGKGFHKFSTTHNFTKPNDKRALDLMDRAAKQVMTEVADVIIAFGESDEYSFLVRKQSKLYNRRQSKILTLIVSLFTSAYVYYWRDFFPDLPLAYPPVFDGRLVPYPGVTEVKDYFKWRGVDTHINNLYNTTFWALVQQGGQSTAEAHKTLSGTFSKDKHEILFSRFGVNYNGLPAQYRKGSTLIRTMSSAVECNSVESAITGADDKVEGGPDVASGIANLVFTESQRGKKKKKEKVVPFDGTKGEVAVIHEDIVRDEFWEERPWLLA